MSFRAGNTFQHRNTIKYHNHLCIILCHDTEPPEQCVIVNITSDAYDTTCTLDIGDHPFIERASYIWYRKAVITEVSKIEAGVRAGVVTRDQDISPGILRKLQQGALQSPGTSNEIKEFVKAHVDF